MHAQPFQGLPQKLAAQKRHHRNKHNQGQNKLVIRDNRYDFPR
jgi:hypothetical protein